MEHGEAMKAMKELLSGPDPFEVIAEYGRRLPAPWAGQPPELWFEQLRCMLMTTQQQIALRSGLDQSVVSRLEGGFDARLSSWRKAYAALGFDLVLLPVARSCRKELERLAASDRKTKRWWRLHARPRRRRLRMRAAGAATSASEERPSTA